MGCPEWHFLFGRVAMVPRSQRSLWFIFRVNLLLIFFPQLFGCSWRRVSNFFFLFPQFFNFSLFFKFSSALFNKNRPKYYYSGKIYIFRLFAQPIHATLEPGCSPETNRKYFFCDIFFVIFFYYFLS